MSSLGIAIVVGVLIAAFGLVGPPVAKMACRASYGRALARHDRRRGRAAHPPARPGPRPPHLDGLRRLQHPADRAADDRGARARIRSRNAPVRTRGRSRPRASCGAISSGRTSSSGATTTSRAVAYDASFKAMGDLEQVLRQPRAEDARRRRRCSPPRAATTPSSASSGFSCRCRPATPVSWPLIYAVTGWSCLMFAGMGLAVAAERHDGDDAGSRRGVGRRGDLSHSRIQQALYQLDPRFADRARTGDR